MSGVPLVPDRPYRVLLRHQLVRWQAVSGLLAQVTQGASGVGIILVVRQHTGSIALAGGVVGALLIAAGFARPLQGRLIDRRGAAGVVAATGIGHGAALTAIVLLAGIHTPGAALLALGAAAGLFLPPISTAMRVDWGELSGAADRTAAYSLVYLVQELAFLAGPLILAAVIAAADSSAAVLVIAGVTAVGGLSFASRARRPPALALPPASATGWLLRARAAQLLVLVAALLGGVVGGLEVAAPTLATAHRQPAASGLLIAALSIGGIVGAAVYASRRWRTAPPVRLAALLTCLTVAVAVASVPASLVPVGALLLAAGLAINPSLTTITLLIDRHTPGGAAAEAFGWLSTGFAGGTGVASAIAGAVTPQGGSARPAFIVAVVAGAAAVAAATVGRRALGEAGLVAPLA